MTRSSLSARLTELAAQWNADADSLRRGPLEFGAKYRRCAEELLAALADAEERHAYDCQCPECVSGTVRLCSNDVTFHGYQTIGGRTVAYEQVEETRLTTPTPESDRMTSEE